MNIHDYYEDLEIDFGYVPNEIVRDNLDIYAVSEENLKNWILRDFNVMLNESSTAEDVYKREVYDEVSTIFA